MKAVHPDIIFNSIIIYKTILTIGGTLNNDLELIMSSGIANTVLVNPFVEYEFGIGTSVKSDGVK